MATFAPTSDEAGEIIHAALHRNEWTVFALAKDERGPAGVVAFDRPHYPIPGKRSHGTARWSVVRDGTVNFYSGHYDLSRAEAIRDFTERIR